MAIEIETAAGTRPGTRRDLWRASLERAEQELRSNEAAIHDSILTHGSTPDEYRSHVSPLEDSNRGLREQITTLRHLLGS